MTFKSHLGCGVESDVEGLEWILSLRLSIKPNRATAETRPESRAVQLVDGLN